MKTTACLSLFLLFVSGCKSILPMNYVQVLSFSNTDIEQTSKPYFFDKIDNIEIRYSFWDNGGILAYYIENQSEIPIIIDWSKSFYFIGDKKHYYWNDVQVISSSGSSIERVNNEVLYKPYDVESEVRYSSISYIITPEKETIIPPNSVISTTKKPIRSFKVVLERTGKKDMYSQNFELSNSPVVIRNYITYRIGYNSSEYLAIDNKFFLKNIIEINEEEFASIEASNKSFYIPIHYSEATRNIGNIWLTE